MRYRELNDLSNSLLERISRKNLSDPDSVRSSIRRINRIYSVLGLSQEAGLLTGRSTALLIREQMKQDAFSQTSQVTDSVWEEFAKNRGIKTLGRPYSRNSFVSLLMLSEGYPFDSLFSTDPAHGESPCLLRKKGL